VVKAGCLLEAALQAVHRLEEALEAGLAIKNPPKKNQKKTPKKPLKMGFLVFFYFYFFMKIIQTFLFETDFL
jgi:hypothetical protein